MPGTTVIGGAGTPHLQTIADDVSRVTSAAGLEIEHRVLGTTPPAAFGEYRRAAATNQADHV